MAQRDGKQWRTGTRICDKLVAQAILRAGNLERVPLYEYVTVAIELQLKFLLTTRRSGATLVNVDFAVVVQTTTINVIYDKRRSLDNTRLLRWSCRLRWLVAAVDYLRVHTSKAPSHNGNHTIPLKVGNVSFFPTSIFIALLE